MGFPDAYVLTPGDHIFVTDGLELWYRVAGTGPLCVMLTPGWGMSSEPYFLMMKPLEATFTMVYHDTRGTGRSQKPPTPKDYTFDHLAADLDALRQHLGQQSILVMGHSQGSMHALYYALKYAQGCAGLLLLDAFAAFDGPFYEEMQRNILARRNESWFAAAYEAFSNAGSIASDEAFARHLIAIMPFYFLGQSALARYASVFEATTFSVAARAGQIAAQLGTNLLPDLHNIAAPTLLLTGSDDFICSPHQAQRIQREIEGSQRIIIPEAGHFPWFEQPDDFFAKLKAGAQALGMLDAAATA